MIIKGEGETKKLAKKLASDILADKKSRSGAVVLALVGDLGAGKTTFAQGFAEGLGIKEKITSPSFLIIKSYKLKSKNYKLFYHIDTYRLNSSDELLALGFVDILKDSKNIILIEWADKVRDLLPQDAKVINFQHSKAEGERIIIH